MTDTWAGSINPANLTGFGAGQADSGSGGLMNGLQAAAQTQSGVGAPVYSPDNPLFWFGALLLAAAGLIAVSASVKAGPLQGKASV